jgi:hypothetical protein
VALKKPSELFHNDSDNNKSIIGNIKNSIESNVNISEDFSLLKEKLESFSATSNFTETIEEFKNNISQISFLSKEIEKIKEEIKDTSKKEELDKTMVTYLVSIEAYIDDVQENIKSLNSKSISRLKSDFIGLKNQVKDFIENDVPKYDKLIVESEVRSSSRIDNVIGKLEEKFDQIDQYSNKKFKELEKNLEGINEKSLYEIKKEVSSLFEYVNNFSNEELPKYKRIFTEGKLKSEEYLNTISKKVSSFEENLKEEILKVNLKVENFSNIEIPKYNDLLINLKLTTEEEIKSIEKYAKNKIDVFSNELKIFEKTLSEENSILKDDIQNVISSCKEKIDSSIDEFSHISKVYENTLKDIKNREINVDRKLETFSKSIDNLVEAKEDISQEVSEISKKYEENIINLENNLNQNLLSINNDLNEKIEILQKDILINEQRIIQRNKDYQNIKEDIYSILEKLKVDFIEEQNKKLSKKISHIEEVFNKFNEKTLLNESGSLLTNPPSTKTSDPLTPLDKNFVTFKDLAEHYRTFINRVQIQMASIGGGGAGFIKDLGDVDITGITTDSILKWNPSNNKWIIGVSGGVGAGGTWSSNSVGIHTTKNVGIGTTTAQSGYALYVQGDGFFSGNVSVAGTITYEDVTNVDSIGFVTARSGLLVGSATTFTEKLVVEGDARVTGILTIGTASITIDGTNNTITVGDENVVINNSSITIGSGVSISSFASGINTAPNVLYVAKDGNDSNNGTSIDNAFLTIKSAVGIATTGTIIKVLAGKYIENNPIEVPPFVSIVGDDLKTVTVVPQTTNQDIFHVRKGCYIAEMTFIDHIHPAAAIAFPTNSIATNEGGGKWESPYIQNCTSNTTTGTGLRIDGAQSEGLKSMVCDSYTQYNQGGVGVAVTNEGFAQLVSVFTICCNEAITCYKGSQVDLTNSNSSFGTYGLVADGVSNLQYTGVVTSSAANGQDNVVVAITTTSKPYDGQVVYFDKLYQSVQSITVSAGGTGYTSTPIVTVDAPTGPNGETALAFATLNGDSISEITLISSGSQYESIPNITISAPNIGINTAIAVANMAPIYYTINSSTPISSGISTLTLDENLISTVSAGTTAYFHQVSRIVASSHTFEYVGSGNDITTAIPKNGGVTIQENEVLGRNGGKVVYTSTDQSGNFRIGDGLQINQNTGTISGRSFTRSLFSEMTPFILALS